MAIVATAIGGAAIGLLYRAAFEGNRASLIQTARSQARLMEAIARSDLNEHTHTEGTRADKRRNAAEVSMAQIVDALKEYEGMGDTGEFTLARREGENIVFLLRHRHSDPDKPKPVNISSLLAEPMRRALSGQSGSVVGFDYRGVMVLAAYEPVGVLDLGIVAKIDMTEVRKPFIRAGLAVVGIAVVLIGIGTLLFFYISSPMVRKIEESEEIFRRSFEDSQIPMNQTSLEGTILRVNRAFSEKFGYSEDDIVGRSPHELLVPSDRMKRGEIRKAIFKDNLPSISIEGQYICKDGSILWMAVSITMIRAADRTPLFTIAHYQDITKRKLAEDRQRALFEQASDLIFVSDPVSRRFLDVNTAAIQRLGYSREEILASKTTDIVKKIDEDIRQKLSEESTYVYEAFLICKDGAEFPVEISLHQVEFGEQKVIQGFVRDITERLNNEIELTKAQEDTKQSLDTLNLAVNAMSSGFALYDNEDRLVICNEIFRNLYPGIKDIIVPGVTFEEMLRTSVANGEVISAIGIEEEWIRERTKAHLDSDYSIEYQMDDGRWILAVERKTDSGGSVGERIDITEHKNSEDQLRQAQKMEAVGQLSSGIAHDFNNLLLAALGNIELIDDYADDPKLKDFAGTAKRAILRGAELTKRLLAFSSKQTLIPEPTKIEDLVNGLRVLFRRTLPANINIDWRIPTELWPVTIDQGQLESALLNLALNSRDAMPDGGTLTIACENSIITEAQAKDIRDTKVGEFVAISVMDCGKGIEESLLDKIIDPFFTTKGVGEGSGLGLSMVYGFVRQSGGGIDIESELGIGTKVTLYFHRVEMAEDAQEVGLTEPSETPLGNGETILIIEDEPDVRDITTLQLKHLGYNVIDGGDGKVILDNCDEHSCSFDTPIQLVLSDVVLPNETSGPELIKIVKRCYPDAKVLLMTGYAEMDILRSEDGELIYPILGKPFTKEELAWNISGLLDGPAK